MSPKPAEKPQYVAPEPVEEAQPLVDALTFQACSTCIRVDDGCKAISEVLDRLDRRAAR